MNILFINANLYGHINPTLGLVHKLTEKKHQVDYFCGEAFMQQVTKMGAHWIGYSDKLNQFLKHYQPTDRHPFFMILEYMLLYDEVVLPEALSLLKAKSYDMVICDSYFGGAYFLQQIVKIPVVCSHSSFAMSQTPVPQRMLVKGFHPQLDHCYQILERICKNYEIEEPSIQQVFTSKCDLNIVYTSQQFNGDEKVHEPDYLFTGPSIDRLKESCDLDFSLVQGRKIIYISLGSINTDFIDFYKMCLLAFQGTDYYVFMSIGKKVDCSQLGEIPPNFVVRDFLPQLEILKRAEVFITHAGFNSVNEALYFGVPMLALPQVNDQHMVAKRLASMQLGLTASLKELSIDSLKANIQTLVTDKLIKENCMKISGEMRHFAKIEQTVSKLEKYVEVWKEKK